MKKNRVFLMIFAVILVAAILAASGCITIVDTKATDKKPGASSPQPAPSGADNPPNVTALSASAAEVGQGQSLAFTFTVTDDVGLARVELWRMDETAGVNWREISRITASGKSFSGTISDAPQAPGTYSYGIHAVDTAGKWNSEVNSETGSKPGVYGPKKVLVKGADRPELMVSNIELISGLVYYTIKNAGAAESKGCRANLYIDDLKKADDYIEALAPGQERKNAFSNYTFNYVFSEHFQQQFSGAIQQYAIKVCADVENVIVENDESNNCKSAIWGDEYVYKFVDFAHQAFWTTGYGELKLPLPEENANGSARVGYLTLEDNLGYGASLLTSPQQVNNGWIEGKFGEFYTNEFRQTSVRDIEVPKMTMFTAKVGFSSSTPKGSQAKFTFDTVDPSGRVIHTQSITAVMDGKLQDYKVDLSSVAGKKCKFVLRVEAIGPAANVRPVWVEPKLWQPQ